MDNMDTQETLNEMFKLEMDSIGLSSTHTRPPSPIDCVPRFGELERLRSIRNAKAKEFISRRLEAQPEKRTPGSLPPLQPKFSPFSLSDTSTSYRMHALISPRSNSARPQNKEMEVLMLRSALSQKDNELHKSMQRNVDMEAHLRSNTHLVQKYLKLLKHYRLALDRMNEIVDITVDGRYGMDVFKVIERLDDWEIKDLNIPTYGEMDTVEVNSDMMKKAFKRHNNILKRILRERASIQQELVRIQERNHNLERQVLVLEKRNQELFDQIERTAHATNEYEERQDMGLSKLKFRERVGSSKAVLSKASLFLGVMLDICRATNQYELELQKMRSEFMQRLRKYHVRHLRIAMLEEAIQRQDHRIRGLKRILPNSKVSQRERSTPIPSYFWNRQNILDISIALIIVTIWILFVNRQ